MSPETWSFVFFCFRLGFSSILVTLSLILTFYNWRCLFGKVKASPGPLIPTAFGMWGLRIARTALLERKIIGEDLNYWIAGGILIASFDLVFLSAFPILFFKEKMKRE
jgi:hypothetical protein